MKINLKIRMNEENENGYTCDWMNMTKGKEREVIGRYETDCD